MVDSGMSVSTGPLSIKGKILPPPTIHFKNGKIVRYLTSHFPIRDTIFQDPNWGGWNLTNQELHTPMPLLTWGVLNLSLGIPPNRAHDLALQLARACNTLGQKSPSPFSLHFLTGRLSTGMRESSMRLIPSSPSFDTLRDQPASVGDRR
jgi:hypothetical protein